jgi:hypothetical protein
MHDQGTAPDEMYYTFNDGRRLETDEISVYGVSSQLTDTDYKQCEVASILVNDDEEWRYATDDELDEINNNGSYMKTLIDGIIEDLQKEQEGTII